MRLRELSTLRQVPGSTIVIQNVERVVGRGKQSEAKLGGRKTDRPGAEDEISDASCSSPFCCSSDGSGDLPPSSLSLSGLTMLFSESGVAKSSRSGDPAPPRESAPLSVAPPGEAGGEAVAGGPPLTGWTRRLGRLEDPRPLLQKGGGCSVSSGVRNRRQRAFISLAGTPTPTPRRPVGGFNELSRARLTFESNKPDRPSERRRNKRRVCRRHPVAPVATALPSPPPLPPPPITPTPKLRAISRNRSIESVTRVK